EETRVQADGFVALLTPVVKAAFTDFGFEIAVQSQQVFGGHGYIREWGMEQYVRDARIAQIYEGTNGVQAMDLVGRKLQMENGELPWRFFDYIKRDLQVASMAPQAQRIVTATAAALDRLSRSTAQLVKEPGDSAEAGAAATDYLRLFALTAFGWMWAKMVAKVATNTLLGKRKMVAGNFFANRLLPQTVGLEVAVASGAETIMVDADLV
ncbi:MAG TPA: acyl-CoA dehydrogenase C-terminal domain-containing protein, partial [Paraburkholderia sp.]